MDKNTTLNIDIALMPKTFNIVPHEEPRCDRWHVRTGTSGFALFFGEEPRGLLFGGFSECKVIADALNVMNGIKPQENYYRIQWHGKGHDGEIGWQTMAGSYPSEEAVTIRMGQVHETMLDTPLRAIIEINPLTEGKG